MLSDKKCSDFIHHMTKFSMLWLKMLSTSQTLTRLMLSMLWLKMPSKSQTFTSVTLSMLWLNSHRFTRFVSPLQGWCQCSIFEIRDLQFGGDDRNGKYRGYVYVWYERVMYKYHVCEHVQLKKHKHKTTTNIYPIYIYGVVALYTPLT